MFRIGALVLLGAAFAFGRPLVAAAAGLPHAGDVAPPFSLARAKGGASETLASLKGKPVYVNFFATWCGPCNEEAPAVEKLYKKFHPKGLVTVGINELEEAKKALEFASKYGYTFDVLLDDGGKMARDYGALALPVHVFIDRKGKVSTYRLGEMSPAEIDEAIRKIL